MEAKILSLNIGGPEDLVWEGRSIRTSMHKKTVEGPLIVHADRVEGDSFANHQVHGVSYAVLYAFGLSSIRPYLNSLGIESFENGDLGETLTLDHFDEDEISVGDIFQMGDVTAQVSWPRVPCAKLNFRLQHADAMKRMIDIGKSGVYFRILNPGRNALTDRVVRIEKSAHPIPLGPFYRKLMSREPFSTAEIAHFEKNGALPDSRLAKLLRA